MPRLTVLDPGPLTTVQDGGRHGLAHLGVPGSGALDLPSYRLANRLVGNPPGAAALEVTFGGLRLRFHGTATLAVTGAPVPVWIGRHPAPVNTPLPVPAGSTVVVERPVFGVRSYVAVAGGLDVPLTLGSRSSDLLSDLGPPPLRAGDELELGRSVGEVPWGLEAPPTVDARPVTLRLHPGPRLGWFRDDPLAILRTGSYRLRSDSNRVGVRLEGPPLRRSRDGELPSEGVVTGAVEVPADGQSLVFLADHPTTGGYPVVAVVDPADIPRLAQATPGTTIRFA